jgi:hypothetical protein
VKYFLDVKVTNCSVSVLGSDAYCLYLDFSSAVFFFASIIISVSKNMR